MDSFLVPNLMYFDITTRTISIYLLFMAQIRSVKVVMNDKKNIARTSSVNNHFFCVNIIVLQLFRVVYINSRFNFSSKLGY